MIARGTATRDEATAAGAGRELISTAAGTGMGESAIKAAGGRAVSFCNIGHF